MKLDGKIAVVTGGSSGIGKAIVDLFLAEGATVIAADIKEGAKDKAGKLTFVSHDVTQESQWITLFKKVTADHGGFDVLVNCAGIPGANPQDAVHCSTSTWRKVIAVNLEGVFFGCRSSIPYFEKRGSGSIINISSLAGRIAVPFAVAYAASKAGVSSLTKSVALYCAAKNPAIRCNSIAPGAIDTPIWEPFFGNDDSTREIRTNAIVDRIPMKRFGEAKDIAQAALFLASSESKFMTGTEMLIDGGQGAHG